MNHKHFMQRALELAERAKGKTSPNPMVGAVVVKGGKIISSGYHKKAGTAHAEALAINKAGKHAKGSTLYVTLEPCCHTEKRTPPCTEAIVEAGIKSVITAMVDPNPSVSGKGIRELRGAGIEVITGVLKQEAAKLNEAFVKYITKKEPFVILKVAQTLDGKIATARGESKWITGPESRKHVHQIRSSVDAILTGIGTVINDNPSLDCRTRGGKNPYRIIVDSSLKIPLNSKVLTHGDNKTIIATTEKTSVRKINKIEKLGCKVITVKNKAGRVDLNGLMKKLFSLEIMSIMIEGGSTLNAAALSSRIVDRVIIFIAPKIIGGIDSIPSVGGKSPALLKNALKLKNIQIRQFGDDVLLEGYIVS